MTRSRASWSKEFPGFRAEKIQGKYALRAVENADVFLEQCRVPAANKLEHANSFADTTKVLRLTRGGVAWSAVGVMVGAYERAVAYARDRVQFGKPIASFQLHDRERERQRRHGDQRARHRVQHGSCRAGIATEQAVRGPPRQGGIHVHVQAGEQHPREESDHHCDQRERPQLGAYGVAHRRQDAPHLRVSDASDVRSNANLP